MRLIARSVLPRCSWSGRKSRPSTRSHEVLRYEVVDTVRTACRAAGGRSVVFSGSRLRATIRPSPPHGPRAFRTGTCKASHCSRSPAMRHGGCRHAGTAPNSASSLVVIGTNVVPRRAPAARDDGLVGMMYCSCARGVCRGRLADADVLEAYSVSSISSRGAGLRPDVPGLGVGRVARNIAAVVSVSWSSCHWCSHEMCDVSMLPSSACTQLQNVSCFTGAPAPADDVGARSRNAGIISFGPM